MKLVKLNGVAVITADNGSSQETENVKILEIWSCVNEDSGYDTL